MMYYNEPNKDCALWLKEAMREGIIGAGEVDQRLIQEIDPNDLKGYTQHHFFAGIGGWAIALRLAGWDDARPVWTGSCPCQPFSTAGNRKGTKDDRHLWPYWYRLIREHKPATVFGEQVTGAIAFGWLDQVADDLEAEGYAFGAVVLPACSVGAPHKRDRLWFVGDSQLRGCKRFSQQQRTRVFTKMDEQRSSRDAISSSNPVHVFAYESSTMGDSQHNGQPPSTHQGIAGSDARPSKEGQECTKQSSGTGDTSDMAHSVRQRQQGQGELCQSFSPKENSYGEANRLNDFSEVDWIKCPDGKQRAVEPSICLLVNGIPSRLRKAALQGYGNAIVPQVAAEFIKAYMETTQGE